VDGLWLGLLDSLSDGCGVDCFDGLLLGLLDGFRLDFGRWFSAGLVGVVRIWAYW
jgi:hypothetical protein